jgi:phosphatidylglycerol:prolipoprotein diacylglycerol transferase
MHPVLFKLGPLTLHTYGLLLAIAFLVGLFLIQRDARRFGLNVNAISDLCFWCLVMGVIGSRVAHVVMYPDQYSLGDPLGWLAIWRGGLVFQGGFLAALLFGIWFAWYRKLDFGRTIDAAVPYLPLAHAIGRLGCFFGVGCCYGRPTDLPWGVSFPRHPSDVSVPATGSEPYLHFHGSRGEELWSPPIHPTQLYEAFGLVLIFMALLYVRRRWHPFNGFILPTYMVLYGILRFINEFFRGDGNPVVVFGLTEQQVFSVLTAVVGLVIFAFYMRRRPVKVTAGP